AYAVTESHLRRVGRDSMISFAGSSYSVAARAVDGRCTRAGQRVEVRVGAEYLEIWRQAGDSPDGRSVLLARHRRSATRGALVVDPAHWAELPDGHTRATTTQDIPPSADTGSHPEPVESLLPVLGAGAGVVVARRPLADYDRLAGLAAPPGTAPSTTAPSTTAATTTAATTTAATTTAVPGTTGALVGAA
ncbi:MAG: hypothetical protein M3235_22005, partial [Actinomycetota bacterium]|nr:hypothetical protein [Actinomycetota bacterium]